MKILKMSNCNINDYVPSTLNPRSIKREKGDLNGSQISVVSRCSLSLKKNHAVATYRKELNKIHTQFVNQENEKCLIKSTDSNIAETLDFSATEDLNSLQNDNQYIHPEVLNNVIRPISSDTIDNKSDNTIIYNVVGNAAVSLSFSIANCKNVNITTQNTNIKEFSASHEHNSINVQCKVIEGSCLSSESDNENMYDNTLPSPPMNQAVAVNLEIKRKKCLSRNYNSEETNVLILKTNAIERFSHVNVQPPNYKLIKRKVSFSDNLETGAGLSKNAKISVCGDVLKQKSIDGYLCKTVLHAKKSARQSVANVHKVSPQHAKPLMPDVEAMSKNSGVNDIVPKCNKVRATSFKVSRENDKLSSSKLYSPKRDIPSFRQQDIKASISEVPRSPSTGRRNGSISSYTPRKNIDSLHFSLPSKSRSSKNSVNSRNVPFYKIVAGTHFAVDAFSYGDIPNVNSYFLTHFHSDHYSGLKRTFNKSLFCSKITADLCIARLGVSPKYLQIINIDETIKIEGVEVTAVDANHCPGAIMLVFTLPNGKTLLHTGDFRGSPVMESYPIFWNRDMHTIYLDTTYCNPRYDFPTQDQSLEIALQVLRDKKTHLEETGKKFSSVLIVCGTYTIGKEKFFLGIARRVGCSVWACPEKVRVLQIVEGRSFSRSPPQACQLHVVPMRELTHEKLRAYLDSLQGAFSEIVAFKPSGWENGKNSAAQKDLVTIHGIPYSEHSSFSEMIRFVKFLKPKQVVPTVEISGGVKTVQQFFPCPLVYKEDMKCQSRLTDYFSVQNRQQVHVVS